MPVGRFAVLLCAMAIVGPNTAFAQDISSNEVVALLKADLQQNTCIPLPIGEFEVSSVKGDIAIYAKIGLIQSQPEPPNRIRVSMKMQPDGKELQLRDGKPCIEQFDVDSASYTVSKIEPVKGGATGWLGAIAYVESSLSRSSLYQRYFDEFYGTKQPTTSNGQSRILFRQDPFSGKWKMVTWDPYVDGKFIMSRVTDELRKD